MSAYKWALALFFAVIASVPAYRSSPTFDEVGLLAAGLVHWDRGRFEPFAVNPPMIRMLGAFPVYCFRPVMNWRHLSPRVSIRTEIQLGSAFLDDNRASIQFYYCVARLVCVGIVASGLVVACMWAESIYGVWSGVLTGILWCSCPMLLGHGSLMTADASSATLGVIAFFLFRHWLIVPSIERAILCGIGAGLALSAKFTWALIIPLAFLILWGSLRYWQATSRAEWINQIGQIFIAIVASLLVINLFYLFQGFGTPIGEIEFVSKLFANSADNAIAANRFSGTWLSGLPTLVPPIYLQGIDLQRQSMNEGAFARSYLMGEWKDGGWWHYYLVGWLVKTPWPTIVITMGAAVYAVSRLAGGPITLATERHDRCGERSRHPRLSSAMDAAILTLPILFVLVLVSSQTGFSRHLRYLLPAYPFILIAASGIARCRQKVICRATAALVMIQVLSVMWHGPHWLSYFNEIAGGPKRGGKWMINSNLDWGQDLYYLRQWMHEHPDAAPLYRRVYSAYDSNAWGDPLDAEAVDDAPNLFYAVSMNVIRGGGGCRSFGSDVQTRWMSIEPFDWAGYSICIFKTDRSNPSEH